MKLPSQKEFVRIYGEGKESLMRYRHLGEKFSRLYGQEQVEFFSAPGRMELLGNHTDHNGGKVIAASIDMDTIGAARPNGSQVIRIHSEGYEGEIRVDLSDLKEVERGHGTQALTAGLAEGIQRLGFRIGGFDAFLSSNVIAAAGVSSSASFEMLVCAIANHFFNEGAMDCVDYARAGQYAENVYWEKASGMMDQLACAVGGMILLDFQEKEKPVYRRMTYSARKAGYGVVIVNTGKGHADLGQEYSRIPLEMREAAYALGAERLCEAGLDDLLAAWGRIPNDRAFLRAMHFFRENDRVKEAQKAMEEGRTDRLLRLLNESGHSSWEWLQNCYCPEDCKGQKVALALALTRLFLDRIGDGACRVHGGGFAGVILCVLPLEVEDAYVDYMAGFMGRENIFPMEIRQIGAVKLPLEK